MPESAIEGPPVEGLTAEVYVIPTDAPEADGTLAWDSTTMVLVAARAGGQEGIGWSYAAGAAAAVVSGVLAGVAKGPDSSAPPSPTCGTSSTSMIISASSNCSSTARSARRAAA